MALPVILQQYLNYGKSGTPPVKTAMTVQVTKLNEPGSTNSVETQEQFKLRIHLKMMLQKKPARIPLSNAPDPYQKQVPFVSDHTAGWNPVNNGFKRGTHI